MNWPEAYPLIKSAHVGLVALSLSLFGMRLLANAAGSALALHKAVRRLSYLIDSLLLAAGLGLLALLHLAPWSTHWLAAKLMLLPVYVVAGSVALRRGKSPMSRRLGLAIAVLSVAQMIAIARTHNALGLLTLLASG